MPSSSITNALIRCTRQDREAESLFEHVQPDLGLWVLELDYSQDALQAVQIAEICRQLRTYSACLQRLREGSCDYTLHLRFDLPETERIIVTPELSRLASECGFNLEICVNPDEDG